MKPMLCHTVDLSDVDRLINSPEWFGQQKLDGDRLLIHVKDMKVMVLNREGTQYRNPVPQAVVREFEVLDGEWYFDGELLDDGTFWLFDLPFANHRVRPDHDFDYRTDVLESLFVLWNPGPSVRLLATVRTPAAKRALFDKLRADGCEGMIFKRTDGHYQSTGRRSRAVLKAKFTNTVDAVVTAVRPEGRDNAMLGLFADGALVPIGSVSLVGRPNVSVGQVIEVRYLYAGTEHKLVQPVMLGVRHDKAASECTLDQLVYTCRDVVEAKRTYAYRATGRRGADMTGTFTDENPGDFARVRFQRRWQWLEILDENGDHVAGIQPHPDTGKRIWWG